MYATVGESMTLPVVTWVPLLLYSARVPTSFTSLVAPTSQGGGVLPEALDATNVAPPENRSVAAPTAAMDRVTARVIEALSADSDKYMVD
jgi:hypothetical protein